MIVYKSEQFQMAAAGDSKQPANLAFAQPVSVRGFRNVITRFRIVATYGITTDAGTTITGAGQAAVLQRLRIWDAQGDLWNIDGPTLRAKHIEEYGRWAEPDPAACIANTADQSRTFTWIVDFAPRYRSLRRWDYCLPVDVLLAGGGIQLQSNPASVLGTGGGASYSTAPTFIIYADVRDEADLEGHSRREVRTFSSNNLEDINLPMNGAYCRSAFLFKPADHATGGTDLSSITQVNIEAMGLALIPPSQLQAQFREEGEADSTSTTDPFMSSTYRALPLVIPTAYGKMTDMHRHDGQMLVRAVGNTVQNLPVCVDLVTRQTDLSTAAERARAGGGPKGVKTEGKTKKSFEAWKSTPLVQVLPKKY